MPKISDIIFEIERFAPLELQADFDNSGLLFGDINASLTGVLVTLDTNTSVVQEAIDKGCNLIIEHHPSIFNPIKKIDITLPLGKAIAMAIKNDIAIYSAHTNVDFTKGGLNDKVAKMLGCYDIRCIKDELDGARIGTLKKPMTLKDFAIQVEKILGDKHIATVGNPHKLIEKIAVINGGGGGSEEVLLETIKEGADLFVTSDIKYNVVRLAKDLDYAIMYFGHYDSEIMFIDLVFSILAENGYKQFVHKSEKCENPYN